MFIINPAPPALDAELVERYKKIAPADVGHHFNSGYAGVDIKRVWPHQRAVGRAITVRTVSLDSTAVHKAIDFVQPGDVVVVDMAGEVEHSCWGGGVARAAQLKGAAGAIINGPVTDVGEIEELGFPVWGRNFTCLTTRLLGYGGEINVSVRCGNAVVNPGDLVIADDSGAIFVSPDLAWKWLPTFEAMPAHEAEAFAKIAAGASLADLFGANHLIEAKNKELAGKLK